MALVHWVIHTHALAHRTHSTAREREIELNSMIHEICVIFFSFVPAAKALSKDIENVKNMKRRA